MTANKNDKAKCAKAPRDAKTTSDPKVTRS